MHSKKLSINKLSTETGISRPTLTSMVNGESKGIQFDTLEKLMNYFNVSLGDLLTEQQDTTTFSFRYMYPFDNVYVENEENVPFEANISHTAKDSKHNKVAPPQVPDEVAIFVGRLKTGNLEPFDFQFGLMPLDPKPKDVKSISFNISLILFTFYKKDENEDMSPIIDFVEKLNTKNLKKMLSLIITNWWNVFIGDSNLAKLFLNKFIIISLRTVGKKGEFMRAVVKIDGESSMPKFEFDIPNRDRSKYKKFNQNISFEFVKLN